MPEPLAISSDMMYDIALDRAAGATWTWLGRMYGISPQTLQRAFLRKSREVYGLTRDETEITLLGRRPIDA